MMPGPIAHSHLTKKPSAHRFISLLAFVAGVTSPISGALAEALTEDMSVSLSLQRPAVNGLRAARQAEAQSYVIDAERWPNPSLDYARETYSAAATEQSLTLSQPIDLSGRRGLRREAARHFVEAATQGSHGDQLDITRTTREAFYTTLYHERRLVAIGAWSERMQEMELIVRKREAAGEVSGYDRSRLTLESTLATTTFDTETAELQNAWAVLRGLLGDAQASSRFNQITGELLPSALLAPVETLIARVKGRPEQRQQQAQIAGFQAEQRAAARAWLPEFALGLGTRWDDADPKDSGTIANLSLTLPLFDRAQGTHARAAAQEAMVRSELALNESHAKTQIEALWQQTTLLTTSATRARQESIRAAAQLLSTAEAGYRGGEISVLELLDAYRSALDAETHALDLEYRTRLSRIHLDRLAGEITP
jgi:outer membrane protein, heavy metal efflux system